mmetsp:Transcript_139107/g.277363  ORF Transcript_139107/g.277363 Transcript_139107/m.277363 type:complete len:139 (-) Transcript_139107:120-536(-)
MKGNMQCTVCNFRKSFDNRNGAPWRWAELKCAGSPDSVVGNQAASKGGGGADLCNSVTLDKRNKKISDHNAEAWQSQRHIFAPVRPMDQPLRCIKVGCAVTDEDHRWFSTWAKHPCTGTLCAPYVENTWEKSSRLHFK